MRVTRVSSLSASSTTAVAPSKKHWPNLRNSTVVSKSGFFDAFSASRDPRSAHFSSFFCELSFFLEFLHNFLSFSHKSCNFYIKMSEKLEEKCRLFRPKAWVLSFFLEFWVWGLTRKLMHQSALYSNIHVSIMDFSEDPPWYIQSWMKVILTQD